MPTFTSNNTTPAVVAENTMVSTTISPGEGIKATSAGDAILAEGGVGLRAKTRKASGVAIIADAEGPNQALIAESVGGQAAFFSSRSSTSPTVEIMSSADVALQVTGFASKAGVFGGDVDVAGNLNAGSLNVTRNTNLNGDVGVTGSLNVGRNINVNGDVILSGADCAEEFDTAEATETKPGTVMVLNQDGRLHHCQRAYDKRVAGVISGAGDYRPGLILDRQHSRDNRLPVALVGKVYCKVDTQYGPIEVGDLLTTSPTPGYAMKADDPFKAFGSVIGKALCSLEAGRGMIPILIALQ